MVARRPAAGSPGFAADHSLTIAQLALAWVLNQPGISSAIIGATRPEQVLENVKATGVKLSADTLAEIDRILGDFIERDPAKTVSPNPRA